MTGAALVGLPIAVVVRAVAELFPGSFHGVAALWLAFNAVVHCVQALSNAAGGLAEVLVEHEYEYEYEYDRNCSASLIGPQD